MRCPKCEADMEEVKCDDITIDRCSGCQGIWFDTGEAESLSDRWIAEFIDTGNPEQGTDLNNVEGVPCPRCSAAMKQYVTTEEHILYERCEAHGKFFDAGEFTLWAENQYL